VPFHAGRAPPMCSSVISLFSPSLQLRLHAPSSNLQSPWLHLRRVAHAAAGQSGERSRAARSGMRRGKSWLGRLGLHMSMVGCGKGRADGTTRQAQLQPVGPATVRRAKIWASRRATMRTSFGLRRRGVAVWAWTAKVLEDADWAAKLVASELRRSCPSHGRGCPSSAPYPSHGSGRSQGRAQRCCRR
jgi:hypothetical protein